MKIITAVFDYPGENEYSRCVKALENSVAKSNPKADFQVIKLDPPSECYSWNKPGWHNNHIKLQAYSEIDITEPTFFVDADTVILKDLSPLIGDFDIAIAERPTRAKAPFNMGVVLFMPTDKDDVFLQTWIEVDKDMLNDYDFHMKYRKKYMGQNQSSFGYLYEELKYMNIKKYPTKIMNACEQDWTNLDECCILHVKTRLRDAALSDLPLNKIKPDLRRGSEIWRSYA